MLRRRTEHVRRILTLLAAALVLMAQARPSIINRQLLVVLDGLRPDYVRPDIMPNLYALGQRGVVFQNHHSVYPTVTRVNASSIATGAYPATHGLLGNSVFFPAVDPNRFLDTSDRANLLKIDASEKGRLLTATTLGEILQRAGRKMLVVSSGSTGASFLLNYRVAGGAILQNEFALPESLYAEMTAKLGANPPESTPNDAQNRRAVDAFLQIGLPRVDPSVTVLWISDPDATAHQHGIGHPTTLEALKREDGEIKRILDGLAAARQLERYNIWVTSDHGFSTGAPGANLGAILKTFAGTLPDGSPRIVSGGGAIYVRDHDRDTVVAIVSALQKTSGVGAIFTPAATPGGMNGRVEGTVSFDAIRWTHARSADILYSPDWSDQKNQYGFPGITQSGGTAGHGSTSAWDVHNVLVAAGPDIKQKTVIATPSANVDFAPTFLRLAGVALPAAMDGRVLEEALRDGPSPSAMKVEPSEHTVRTTDGTYTLTASFSTVDSGRARYRYFNDTRVERRPAR
jgi:predicted AlkP superfamily pyrophosphatase or phosphodiesterase